MVARPLEPEELLARCDLAGMAEVLDIVSSPDRLGQAARLRFSKITKGRVLTDGWFWPRIAIVKLREPVDEPMPGAWSDYYQPGTRVFTYLDWDPAFKVYRTSWWNAVQVIPSG